MLRDNLFDKQAKACRMPLMKAMSGHRHLNNLFQGLLPQVVVVKLLCVLKLLYENRAQQKNVSVGHSSSRCPSCQRINNNLRNLCLVRCKFLELINCVEFSGTIQLACLSSSLDKHVTGSA
jgi:hypothetical protein